MKNAGDNFGINLVGSITTRIVGAFATAWTGRGGVGVGLGLAGAGAIGSGFSYLGDFNTCRNNFNYCIKGCEGDDRDHPNVPIPFGK